MYSFNKMTVIEYDVTSQNEEIQFIHQNDDREIGIDMNQERDIEIVIPDLNVIKNINSYEDNKSCCCLYSYYFCILSKLSIPCQLLYLMIFNWCCFFNNQKTKVFIYDRSNKHSIDNMQSLLGCCNAYQYDYVQYMMDNDKHPLLILLSILLTIIICVFRFIIMILVTIIIVIFIIVFCPIFFPIYGLVLALLYIFGCIDDNSELFTLLNLFFIKK